MRFSEVTPRRHSQNDLYSSNEMLYCIVIQILYYLPIHSHVVVYGLTASSPEPAGVSALTSEQLKYYLLPCAYTCYCWEGKIPGILSSCTFPILGNEP